MDAGDPKAEELSAVIEEIRQRVRARHPSGSAEGVPLPDLTPILHARDTAEAKVAAIGTVNPRPPGVVNSLIQAWKKILARVLDWHVREQVEFNRTAVSALEAILEALNENNRALARLAAMRPEIEALRAEAEQIREIRERLAKAESETEALRTEARELKDVRSHWAAWRVEWERKLSVNEMQFLRAVADLQTGFQHRVGLMEANFRDLTRSQHADFTAALERSAVDVQKRLWVDLEKVRAEYEKLIQTELRLIRVRLALGRAEVAPVAVPASQIPQASFDSLRFAERFRGSEESVRDRLRFYVSFFEGRSDVVDLGCGRGEFLELMREAGCRARGVDLSEECVAICRSKGLDAERADLFAYLAELPESTLDGVFCAQVVEHLPPESLPTLIRLAASRLDTNGLLAIETPNPECLAIFATYFYLDPTHARPVPPDLLRFYMEEFGLSRIETHTLSPAVDSMPSLAILPAEFREAFFGGLDYAILGRK